MGACKSSLCARLPAGPALRRTTWDAADEPNMVEVDGAPLSHFVSRLGMCKEDQQTLVETVIADADNGDSGVGTSTCTHTRARVEVVTWNVGSLAEAKHSKGSGITEDIKRDMRLLIGTAVGAGRNSRADVVVIGLQEVIPLSASTALVGAPRSSLDCVLHHGWPEAVVQWIELLKDAVNSGEHADRRGEATPRHAAGTQLYVLFGQPVYLFGLLLCVFCRPELVGTNISQFALFEMPADKLASGVKGVVACRFSLFDRSFCFINCHFHAEKHHSHRKKRKDFEQRMEQISHCYRGIEFRMSDQLLYPLWAHRAVFLMGDTNMRLTTPETFPSEGAYRQHVEAKIAEGLWHELVPHDQLHQTLARSSACASVLSTTLDDTWREAFPAGCVAQPFPPTFKLAVPGPGYSQKRIPAWTDRVLYRSREVRPVRYESLVQDRILKPPQNIADHNPVVAVFDVDCIRVSKALLSQLVHRIYLRTHPEQGLQILAEEQQRHFRARFLTTGRPHIDQLAQRLFAEMERRLEGPELTAATDWLIEHQQECWQMICHQLEEQISLNLEEWDSGEVHQDPSKAVPSALMRVFSSPQTANSGNDAGRDGGFGRRSTMHSLVSSTNPSSLRSRGTMETSIPVLQLPSRKRPLAASVASTRSAPTCGTSCFQFLSVMPLATESPAK